MASDRTAYHQQLEIDVRIHRRLQLEDNSVLFQCRPLTVDPTCKQDWIYAKQNDLIMYHEGQSDVIAIQSKRGVRPGLSATRPLHPFETI